jgi:DNA-binding LacI/PurR family transcriptional regulator
VADRLRELMRSGKWPAGSVIPSLRELAGEHRVSQGQIRMAIEVLRSEGWVVTSARRRLVVGQPCTSATSTSNRTVLEVLSSQLDVVVNTPWMDALQRGVERGAGEIGAPLFIAHGQHLNRALPDDLLDLSPVGLVLVGYFKKELFRAYERLNVPVVLVDRPEKEWKLHAASVDNANAVRMSVERLLELGHRRIALFAFMSLYKRAFDPDSVERREGFLQALREAGIKKPKSCLFTMTSTEGASRDAIRGILTASPPFTAVLAVDANCATMVMRAAEDLGLSVPGDLSVACFDTKVPEQREIGGPRVDLEEVGRRAVHLLLEPKRPAQHLRVPTGWSDGRTLAPPRKK